MTYTLPAKVPLPPELDKKAKNIHARMAVYFDNHIYDDPEERDDTLLYQYLYHIIYMLACRKKFFTKFTDYDQFSLFMATRIYLRITNPRHQEEHGRIKSILNYCKALVNRTKVDYQREMFNEIIGTNMKGRIDGSGDRLRNDIEESLQSTHCNESCIDEEILVAITNIPTIIKDVMSETPYPKGTELYHRIYMSVYISLLNSITLSNPALRRISGGRRETNTRLYSAEMEHCVTLWRLDDTYYNMIQMLVVKTRKRICGNISEIRKSVEMCSEDLNAVILSAYGNTEKNNISEDNQ